MKQTLKQRIIHEVDERETQRESEKVASYVEESLKDIATIDGGDSLFNTDGLFEDLEEMQDMTDEFFGDGFSVPGSEGFAGDVLFEGGPGGEGQETETEQLESLRDLEAMFREMGGLGGGMLEPILALEEVMGKNMARNGAIASAVGGMSKMLKAGGATLLLGGVGLAILGGLWSTVKGMAKHSPLLQNVVEMLGMVTTFLIRPFAHMIGQLLLPIIMDLLQISAEFMSISFEQGIMNGMVYLGKTFLDALFSLPGLLAIAITGAGGALGAAIGGAAAAKIGGTIGAILGSVVPGIGTTVGAALGATIGATLAGILGILTAYNIDGILNFITDIADSIDLVRFVAYAILGPFGVLAIEFFSWMKDKIQKMLNVFQDFDFSAVFDIQEPIIKEKQIIRFLKDVVPKFTLWQDIKNAFPGWNNILPKVKWSIPSFPSWGKFIPTIDWDVPELPSASEIMSLVKDMMDPRVDVEIDDYVEDNFEDDTDGSHLGGGKNEETGSTSPGSGIPDDDGGTGGGGGGGLGAPISAASLATGGIVTDTMLTYVGEGRESEVVATLSKLDSMMSSPDYSGMDSGGMGSGVDVEQVIDASSENDDEVIRQLRKIARILNGLSDDISMDVQMRDQSRWEVRE